MIKIGRAIERISINGKEWLLDNNDELMTFSSKDLAIKFLKENGYSKLKKEELEDLFFFEETGVN